jgi:hypothetical protein
MEIFLRTGLDSPNHIDPVQQIALRAQGALANESGFGVTRILWR